MDSGYKLYTNILGKKLMEEIEEKKILSETQMGFRNGRGTIDAIYLLKNMVERELNDKKKVFTAFIDLKAAFDNVDRNELERTMTVKGISDEIKERIMDVISETKSEIRVEGANVGEFWTKKGLRQGCALSADLFNIYMSDMEDFLKGKCKEGGLRIGNKKIWSISYADDICLIASSKEALKEMLKKMEGYLDKKKIKLN